MQQKRLRKWFKVGLGVVVTFFLSLSAVQSEAESNLLKNPGFEQVKNLAPKNWSILDPWYEKPKGSGLSKVDVDNAYTHSGKCALRIIGNNNRGGAVQGITIEDMDIMDIKGARYKFEGWIRTYKLEGNALLSVDLKGEDGKWIRAILSKGISGTTDWVKVSKSFTVPPDCKKIFFYVRTDGRNTGTAWFDDVSFVRLEEETLVLKFPLNTIESKEIMKITSKWEKFADPVYDWVKDEKMKVAVCMEIPGFSYGSKSGKIDNHTIQQIRLLGFNTIIFAGHISKMTKENIKELAQTCKKYNLHMIITPSYIEPVVIKRKDIRKVVSTGGITGLAPCPFDKRYWEDYYTKRLVEIAEVSLEEDIDAIVIDTELYGVNVPGDIGTWAYTNNFCFCDSCFGDFCKRKGIDRQIPNASRYSFLKGEGYLEEYYQVLGERIEKFASNLEREIHKVNPKIILGFFLYPHSSWYYPSFLKGISTPNMPALIFTEVIPHRYGYWDRKKLLESYRNMQKTGASFAVIPGLWLPSVKPDIATHIYCLATSGSGCYIAPIKSALGVGVYAGALSNPEEYRNALMLANNEITKRMKEGEDYRTALVLKSLSKPVPKPKKKDLILIKGKGLTSLKQYIEKGGGLELSGTATHYVNVLGLEKVRAKIWEYAVRGHTYYEYPSLKHEIFKGLGEKIPICMIKDRRWVFGNYFRIVDDEISGKILSTEDGEGCYSFFLEYSLGSGKLIFASSYGYNQFKDLKNPYRKNLTKLAKNILDYLCQDRERKYKVGFIISKDISLTEEIKSAWVWLKENYADSVMLIIQDDGSFQDKTGKLYNLSEFQSLWIHSD